MRALRDGRTPARTTTRRAAHTSPTATHRPTTQCVLQDGRCGYRLPCRFSSGLVHNTVPPLLRARTMAPLPDATPHTRPFCATGTTPPAHRATLTAQVRCTVALATTATTASYQHPLATEVRSHKMAASHATPFLTTVTWLPATSPAPQPLRPRSAAFPAAAERPIFPCVPN